MTTFQIREVETIIAIVWEGFSVNVWATADYDSSGKRVWYYHERALNFGSTTSRSVAVEIGKKELEDMILAANERYAPHPEHFLRSIKDPFVGPVSRTLLVTAAGREMRIRMKTDDYQAEWECICPAFRTRRVRSRRQVISLAKRYLQKEIAMFGVRTVGTTGSGNEMFDDDIPF